MYIYIHTYIHTYMHTHTYIHTCIHTYIHNYIYFEEKPLEAFAHCCCKHIHQLFLRMFGAKGLPLTLPKVRDLEHHEQTELGEACSPEKAWRLKLIAHWVPNFLIETKNGSLALYKFTHASL